VNKYAKPLTEREYEVAAVAGDLLKKGSPEHRIALHCVHRGLNKSQTETLLFKLQQLAAIKVDTVRKVLAAYDGAAVAAPDERFKEGHHLQVKIFEQKQMHNLMRLGRKRR